MTQVTDGMFKVARDVYIEEGNLRAALEAALEVRKPIDADIGEIIGTLRSWAAALDIPSGPFANEDISAAADLIERQAEEIAQLKDFTASLENQGDALIKEVKRLTAERADLIEVLTRILSNQPIINVCGWYPEMSSARALLERLSAREVE